MTNNISPIGLGTAAIGRPKYINIRQEKNQVVSIEDFRKQGRQTLEHAYQKGIRYFDTAPGYGLAEELVIDWLESKNDPAIEVATKWGYTYTANFDPNAIQHEVKDHSLSKLQQQWKQSRQLLPYLTIYQIHSATFESGVLDNEAVLEGLFELKQQHNIEIGITTTGANQLDVIKKALDIHISGYPLFGAFQVTYNILDQHIANMADILRKQSKKIIIKEALANARLFPNTNYSHYQQHYTILQKLSEKYQVGIDAIALRFCQDTLQPFKILSGASNQKQIDDNIKAELFTLDQEDVEMLQSLKTDPESYWTERKKLTWN